MNAEIPLAGVTEGSQPYLIFCVAQPFGQIGQQGPGKGRRSVFTSEVGKGVQNHVLQLALVGQPLDVF